MTNLTVNCKLQKANCKLDEKETIPIRSYVGVWERRKILPEQAPELNINP